jgi:hypothetical protein
VDPQMKLRQMTTTTKMMMTKHRQPILDGSLSAQRGAKYLQEQAPEAEDEAERPRATS